MAKELNEKQKSEGGASTFATREEYLAYVLSGDRALRSLRSREVRMQSPNPDGGS
jgi:hypothetical protein